MNLVQLTFSWGDADDPAPLRIEELLIDLARVDPRDPLLAAAACSPALGFEQRSAHIAEGGTL